MVCALWFEISGVHSFWISFQWTLPKLTDRISERIFQNLLLLFY